MVTKESDFSGIDVLEELKTAEFDYAELSLTHLCSMSEGRLYELSEKLGSLGLSSEACNNFFPPEIMLTGTNVDWDIITRHLDKAFEIARRFGIKVIVFGSGKARMVPSDFPINVAFEQLVELLSEIETYAKDSGIRIAIEPLRTAECNIINSYEEACHLAKSVNAPTIGCLVDYYHLMEEKEDLSSIHRGREFLFHVHLAYPVGRVYPMPDHSAEFIPFYNTLMKSGYKGRISIEGYSKNFKQEAYDALVMLREIEYSIRMKK